MKISIFYALILFVQPLYSQQPDQKINQLSVQGSVELKQTADQASLSFTVKGVGASLREAVEQADRNTKAVTDNLISLGIKRDNMSTSSFFSGENRGDKAFLSSSRDYQATLTTVVKVDSLDLLQSVLFTISESQVHNISQVAFSVKDEVAFRRRARIEAALKAREKAEDLAKALSLTLGRILLVDEVQPTRTGSYPNPFNPVAFNTVVGYAAVAVDEHIGSGFFAQTIAITGQVYVTYELK